MATVKRPVRDRMQASELYVLYLGVDGDEMHLVMFGDRQRTPRIYSRETFDGRAGDQIPICQSLATANRYVGSEGVGVLLPLSEMIDVWGREEVLKWASLQTEPERVREYVDQFVQRRTR